MDLPDDAPEVLRTRRFWSWAGVTYDQVDHFFLVRVPEAVEPRPAALTAMELETVMGHAWWTVDELRATAEVLLPPDLGDVLAGLLLGPGGRG